MEGCGLMKRRTVNLIAGILAVVLLDVAVNVALLKLEFFIASVVIPFVLGVVCALVWGVLSLTRLAGAGGRGQSAYSLNAVISSVVFFLICVAVFAFTKHWDVTWDLTREGRRELAPITKQVLHGLDRDATVYGLFVTSGDSYVALTEERVRRFLERCQEQSPHLKTEFVDPEANPLILQQLELMRASPEGTVVVKSGTRKRVLPISGPNAILEERDFTNALINVVRDSEPKVYFLMGHGEADIDNADPQDGSSILKELLQQESYRVDKLNLDAAQPEVPADASIVVINGQKQDISAREIEALDAFIEQGGRMLVLFDIWTVQRMPGQQTVEFLRPWLEEEFGIVVGEDIILSEESGVKTFLAPDYGPRGGDSPYRGSYNDEHPITRGFDQNMLFVGVRSVGLADDIPDDTTADVLLRSFPDCWAETNLQMLFESDAPVARPDPDELQGAIPLAAAATRTAADADQNARIIVVGSRDFASNGRIQITGHFVMNLFAWLTESEDLIAIRETAQANPAIILTPLQEQLVSWVASLGLLHLVVLAGLATYLVRRRYQ